MAKKLVVVQTVDKREYTITIDEDDKRDLTELMRRRPRRMPNVNDPLEPITLYLEE